jgi:hypothetical protein
MMETKIDGLELPEGYTIEIEMEDEKKYYDIFFGDEVVLFDCDTYEEAVCRAGDHSRGIRYVSVYLKHQTYGGPEEGGWWSDTWDHLFTEVHPTQESAEARATELKDGPYSNEGRRSYTSVLSSGRYEVIIDNRPGESKPKKKPHYE